MSKDIAKLLAARFIARPDVRAIQRSNGDYNPTAYGFDMTALLDHISGDRSYGHYLVKPVENTAKLFAFDIDLDETGILPREMDADGQFFDFQPGEPRREWLTCDPEGAEYAYIAMQMNAMAQELCKAIHVNFGIQTAAAYSGAKGVHVYGFTGTVQAKDAREAAELTLQVIGRYEPAAGNNFFKYKPELGGDTYGDQDINNEYSFQNFTVEVFPKQTEVAAGGYGNLMRLPLGRNLKSGNDAFFLDLRGPVGQLTPRDAVEALTTTDQWL